MAVERFGRTLRNFTPRSYGTFLQDDKRNNEGKDRACCKCKKPFTVHYFKVKKCK